MSCDSTSNEQKDGFISYHLHHRVDRLRGLPQREALLNTRLQLLDRDTPIVKPWVDELPKRFKITYVKRDVLCRHH